MNIRVSGRLSLIFLFIAMSALPAFARGKKNPATTEPGSYKEWGPDIDEIEIVKKFNFADYSRIAVEPVDTSAVNKSADKSLEDVVPAATKEFADQLAKDVKTPVAVQEKAARSENALLIRTKLVSMDPVSRSARYWGGFGAGAAIVKMEGEIVDGQSGKVLARFTQERRSGFGVAGGSSDSLLRRDIRAIATDVANILKAF